MINTNKHKECCVIETKKKIRLLDRMNRIKKVQSWEVYNDTICKITKKNKIWDRIVRSELEASEYNDNNVHVILILA